MPATASPFIATPTRHLTSAQPGQRKAKTNATTIAGQTTISVVKAPPQRHRLIFLQYNFSNTPLFHTNEAPNNHLATPPPPIINPSSALSLL
ncbi:hypothetical protein PTTG_28945 [Puccinia triticina 1-1 BBBD Race 1]|uniref:Uncharacterized protein n=1 Tax=Puccinia triticina (isolate 1-1 / race 1 (BBBD)) TaxID=630390 RepID=A0A180G8S9_PUCT1|nr:hypothetical protein PTTG_28945 [Puccinia triticina 1-1 BBBD Race 1]